MQELYGPNSLKASNYISLLPTLPVDTIGLSDWVQKEFLKLLNEYASVGDVRQTERLLAGKNATNALPVSITDSTFRSICIFVAQWIVVEDLFSIRLRSFLSLYIIAQYIEDGKKLTANFRNEDYAIRGFCDHLSEFDGSLTTIESSPDQRGTSGSGIPDFIIRRKNKLFTVEHTSLPSYDLQYQYQQLWKGVEREKLENALSQRFPDMWVKVAVPMDQLGSKRSVSSLKFDDLLQDIVHAIENTKPSYDGSRYFSHTLTHSDLQVGIAVDESGGYAGCWVEPVAPVRSEDIPKNLENEFLRIFKTKQPKLANAKSSGDKTILLIDSQDIAFTDIRMLANAFKRAVAINEIALDVIDEIYLMYLFGSKILVPVKLSDRVYPNLPEHDEYIRVLLKI